MGRALVGRTHDTCACMHTHLSLRNVFHTLEELSLRMVNQRLAVASIARIAFILRSRHRATHSPELSCARFPDSVLVLERRRSPRGHLAPRAGRLPEEVPQETDRLFGYAHAQVLAAEPPQLAGQGLDRNAQEPLVCGGATERLRRER